MLSDQAMLEIQSPVGHGWEEDLTPTFFEGPSASEVIDNMLCNCKGKDTCHVGGNCTCREQNLACTTLCKCNDNICLNPELLAEEDEEDS